MGRQMRCMGHLPDTAKHPVSQKLLKATQNLILFPHPREMTHCVFLFYLEMI